MNAREPIPIDLIIEILSRLPAKSIARCRCVSKPWASMLSRPYFTELYLAKSCARLQLLFGCQKEGELFFFSAPQVHNPNENTSLVVASHHMKSPFDVLSDICGSVRGLVCLTHFRKLKGRNDTVPLICNPSTRQSLRLPKVVTTKVEVETFLGFDPITKDFKLLSMIAFDPGTLRISREHQVLTLGDKSWRTVECPLLHNPLSTRICINGVLYYVAAVYRSKWVSIVVCFDVRSEKFTFVEKDEGMNRLIHSVLVNYKGKLAALMSNGFDKVTRKTKRFEMWVLQDAEKHEWSKHVCKLSPMWKNVVEDSKLYFVGVTNTNEILLSPGYLSDPFYVFYFNIERKTVRRVEIQGMSDFKNCIVHTFVDHVEDVKLMEML